MLEIRILGTGCPKCKQLEANAREAVARLGLEAEVVKVGDLGEIMSYGVMITPALVVGGEVKTKGKLLSVEEIENLLK